MKRFAVATALALAAPLGLAACSTAEQPHAEPSTSELASATRGLAYAQRVCGDCHAVAAGQEASPNRNAPSFTAIANTPGMTPTALNAWLHSAHSSMPNLVVAPENRADIAAYLESIRRRSGAS